MSGTRLCPRCSPAPGHCCTSCSSLTPSLARTALQGFSSLLSWGLFRCFSTSQPHSLQGGASPHVPLPAKGLRCPEGWNQAGGEPNFLGLARGHPASILCWALYCQGLVNASPRDLEDAAVKHGHSTNPSKKPQFLVAQSSPGHPNVLPGSAQPRRLPQAQLQCLT